MVQDIKERKYWALPLEELFKEFESSEDGLSVDEATERLISGKNIIARSDRTGKLVIVGRQLTNPLILMLIFAALVMGLLGDYENTAFILLAVIVNAILGFYQENKVESALAKLGTYIKERTRVLREGRDLEIEASEIVPGDVIKLTPGVRVPADSRIFRANGLSVDETILTGESLAVEKSAAAVGEESELGERSSMVFGGTLVVDGMGGALVVATGGNTELGRIASLVGTGGKEETPLQKSITRFAIGMGILVVALTAVIFALGTSLGIGIFDMFLISVAIAVSAVPEGLPVAMTVILAVGVERLAKRKGVVKKLLAAETLGDTTLILTDKTGTLTEAKMKLTNIITDKPDELVLELALLNTDVIIGNPVGRPEDWHISGRALDTAIAKAAVEREISIPKVFEKNQIMERKTFSSKDKYSGVHARIGERSRWIYLGAPDVLVERTDTSSAEKKTILGQIDELAYGGSRVLGLAVDKKFVALLVFRDPVREGVGRVIQEISNAGVRTKIVTGDHEGTAVFVAKELGMEVGKGAVLTGRDLEVLSDEALSAQIQDTVVFARVSPEDKLRLVGLYQKLGEVVAVTGDGVNDAPALKGANVGVAIGSGTDVAKEAADLVILDDNFETIVEAIKEGRRVLGNIKKVIVYLLSGISNELILIGGALVAGVALPLNALQILWVNFFSDSLPAVGMAFEGGEPSLTPRRKIKGLMDGEMKFLIYVVGSITSVLLFVLYVHLLNRGLPPAMVRTFIFAAFSVYTLFLAFSVRTLGESIFTHNPFSNLPLLAGVAIGFVLTAAAIYYPPLRGLLGTVSLPPTWLWGVLGVGLVNIVMVELGKLLFIHRR